MRARTRPEVERSWARLRRRRWLSVAGAASGVASLALLAAGAPRPLGIAFLIGSLALCLATMTAAAMFRCPRCGDTYLVKHHPDVNQAGFNLFSFFGQTCVHCGLVNGETRW